MPKQRARRTCIICGKLYNGGNLARHYKLMHRNDFEMAYLPVLVPKAPGQQYSNVSASCLSVRTQAENINFNNLVDRNTNRNIETIAVNVRNKIRELLYKNCAACQTSEFLDVDYDDHDCNADAEVAVQKYIKEAFHIITDQQASDSNVFENVQRRVLKLFLDEVEEAVSFVRQ